MGSLVCTIVLDKTDGGAVTIENSDDGITQSIRMDGTTLVIEVTDGDNTSTITQTAEGIAISCKNFSVEAETVHYKSTKETLHESEKTWKVKSGEDVEIKSDANIKLKASSDLTGKGANVKLKADTEFSGAGQGATFKAASQQAQIEAATVKLASSGQLKAEGAKVDISASGMLKLGASGLLQIKGSITQIEGSVLKLG